MKKEIHHMLVHPNFDMPKLTQKFIRHLKRKNYSLETIKGYEKDLKKFTAYIYDLYEGYILTEEIRKDDILEYLDFLRDQSYKINTVARYFSSIRSFFKYLVTELDFKHNPTLGITTRNAYTPMPEILDTDEMKHLLDVAKEHSDLHHVLLNLIYYTGSRITAARTLLKQHVDLKNGKIYFPRIKGGRDLYLPLHPVLQELLSDYLFKTRDNGSDYVFPSPKFRNRPISAADVRLNLKRILKKSNITKRVTPHVIRHCTATHLTLLGVDQKYIASVLGHTDLRSTARYQHLNVEDLRPAMEKL
jgi:site-specific recombinase XerD